MTTEKQKFVIQEKMKFDKEQTIFENGIIKANPNKFAEKMLRLTPEKILICPFCLKENELKSFMIRESNKHCAKCPNCKQEVLFRTLFSMLNWTGKEFADFVFPYTKMGFWKKVTPDFSRLECKINRFRIYDFWKRYHELRGDWKAIGEYEE